MDSKHKRRTDIQSKGGRARAAALTPERRSEIARQGALAKRAASFPKATHRGNFKEEFGFDVECFVLEDEQKTAVMSQRGMGDAIGLSAGGGRLPNFIKGARVAPYVGHELAEKLANPLIFQWSTVGANTPPALVYGYDVTILIDICNAILAADRKGDLLKRQQNMVRQARIILNASAKAGIKNLVYALAGYDATRDEVIAAFKFFVREEARDYEREFPEELYRQWYRLYDLPKPERNRPWKFKALTLAHVYTPLAKSNGKILDLARMKRARGAERGKKLHQFLSEIGVKALRTHLGQLLGIAQVSAASAQYEHHVEKIFGVQLSFDFPDPVIEGGPARRGTG
jgi:general stress protein YciG